MTKRERLHKALDYTLDSRSPDDKDMRGLVEAVLTSVVRIIKKRERQKTRR